MKVIINEKVYVQVRDILFLARLYNSEKLMDYYLFFINHGHSDSDFIKSNNELLNQILNLDIIIDFTEYQDYTDYHLSNLIISIASTWKDNRNILEHKMDDLRDIISLKRGDLNYSIPLIPNEQVVLYYKDLNLCFKSTIFKDYYIIEGIKGTDVTNYQEALKRGMMKLKELGIITEDQPLYKIITKDSYVVVCLQEEKKKRKGILDRITKTFKKN